MKTYIVKAFTKNPKEGNPAGVIFNSDGLTESEMVEISSKLGFSESAFVQKSDKADVKIRFFSPKQEVDLCGHATIDSFHTLIEEKQIEIKKKYTMETKSGVFEVENCEGLIIMKQKNPKYLEIETDRKLISNLLGIEENELEDLPIQTISTGVPKTIIFVKSLEVLSKIKPDFDGIIKYCREKESKGFYPVVFENGEFYSRQFNPLAGINEDPITGVAAGALGSYVLKYNVVKNDSFVVNQGKSMKKPGKIYVDISDGIKVGGYAVISEEKEL